MENIKDFCRTHNYIAAWTATIIGIILITIVLESLFPCLLTTKVDNFIIGFVGGIFVEAIATYFKNI